MKQRLTGSGGPEVEKESTYMGKASAGNLRRSEARTTKPRKKRKLLGGWRSHSGLTWAEVKEISALAHRVGFNAVLDIMPTEGNDAQRKRYISRLTARFGQSLHRRGADHVGVTIYEKSDSVDLHGHHLCHIDRANMDVLDNAQSGDVVRARAFSRSEQRDVVGYCTKQRLPLPPAAEKAIKHRREKGAAIRGPRWSPTKAAREILIDLDHESRSTAFFPSPAAHQRTATPETHLRQVGQLSLWPELEKPVARLKAYAGGILSPAAALELEHHRRRLGLSQRALGKLVGLSQPQIANAVHGRFGLSHHAASRIRELLAA